MSLTTRQSEILKAIIEEHIECAQPIASVELVEKCSLPVSGATVRNVMSDLVKKGYLRMEHISSGRIPTEQAYRYYISELMEESQISVLEEMALKQKIWEQRYELERLLNNVVTALSDTIHVLALSLTSDGYLSYKGTSHILSQPEFYEIDVAKAVLRLVDDYDLARSIIIKETNPDAISVLIGREIGLANMGPVVMISAGCKMASSDCYISIIGPSRMQYQKVIPIMRYVSGLMSEISGSI